MGLQALMSLSWCRLRSFPPVDTVHASVFGGCGCYFAEGGPRILMFLFGVVVSPEKLQKYRISILWAVLGLTVLFKFMRQFTELLFSFTLIFCVKMDSVSGFAVSPENLDIVPKFFFVKVDSVYFYAPLVSAVTCSMPVCLLRCAENWILRRCPMAYAAFSVDTCS